MDREVLMDRFRLDAGLAVRVIALLRKKVDITRTVLEEAASDEALAGALLSQDLLAGEGPPDEEKVRETARRCGYEKSGSLRVTDGGDGWRTIAFHDDVPADEGDAACGAENGGLPALFHRAGELTLPDGEHLFSSRDAANIKIQALTCQDTRLRIEAIRKFVYIPGPGADKARVLINILNDGMADGAVRREAVIALEKIGLEPELAEQLLYLFDEKDETSLSALRRLASILSGAEDAQKGVVLAVLIELLNRTGAPALSAELMTVLGGQAQFIARSPERIARFFRLTLNHISEHFEPVNKPASFAFRQCYAAAPHAVVRLLWKELERAADPRARVFLISRLSMIREDAAGMERLAAAAVEEYVSQHVSEEQRSYLKNALVRTGEPAVSAVEAKLGNTSGHTRSGLVRLLDRLCCESDIAEEAFIGAVGTMLKLLKVARRQTRRNVLESSMLTDPRVPPGLREEIAGELLSHLSEFRMSNTREDICSSLQKLGPPALPPLLNYLRRRPREEGTDDIFITLGRIAEEAGAKLDMGSARECIGFCMGLFDAAGGGSGKFCIALAWLCGYSPAGREFTDSVVETFLDRVWKAKYTFDIIEALGVLAGSPNIKDSHQRDIFRIFSHVAGLQADAAAGVEKEGEDGPVFEFGSGIRFETIVIPAVIKGIERIGVCGRTPPELRSEVVKRLLVLWEGVSHMRLVRSPAAVEALVNAMGSVASSDNIDSDMRVRLGGALLRCINKNSVVRNLGCICSAPDGSGKMRELALAAAGLLHREWENSYEEDMDRRTDILRSLGAIAANSALDAEDDRIKHMREVVIETLFQGLRAGIFEVKAPLLLLRDCDALAERQRTEIQARLQQAFGLVKTEE